jgi:hypothetical protein
MLQLLAMAVTAVAKTCEQRGLRQGESIEITWRHYRYDPDSVWFIEVEVVSGQRREFARALA